MEANELLALLANLGAQQQAVLAAIAERQQPAFQTTYHHSTERQQGAFQNDADKAPGRGPKLGPSPLQHGTSTVPVGRQVVDISVAAGDVAMAAQQQQKH